MSTVEAKSLNSSKQNVVGSSRETLQQWKFDAVTSCLRMLGPFFIESFQFTGMTKRMPSLNYLLHSEVSQKQLRPNRN